MAARLAITDPADPFFVDCRQRIRDVQAAMQYVCPQDEIGFRYENPILLRDGGCETMSKLPLAVEEID